MKILLVNSEQGEGFLQRNFHNRSDLHLNLPSGALKDGKEIKILEGAVIATIIMFLLDSCPEVSTWREEGK